MPGVPFSARYDDIYFMNAYTGWTFNYNIVYKTTDGGSSWVNYNQQGTNSNRCIGFFDENFGIIGQLSIYTPITRTTNGGVNWTAVSFDSVIRPSGICGISIVNDSTAFACGAYSSSNGNGKAYKTTNKGASWTLVFNDTSLARSLVDCHFWSPDSGLIAGGYNTDGNILNGNSVVLMTVNGGITWNRVFKSARINEWCWKISFPYNSRNFGVVSIERFVTYGLSYFLKTTNGGVNWTEYPFLTYDQEGIGFVDENTGWIGGYTDSTYETTNGGIDWRKVGWGRSLNRIRFINDTLAFASARRIFKYSKTPAVNISAIPMTVPESFQLHQNFPNPFNPTTSIRFDLPERATRVRLTIYDQTGKLLRELVNDELEAGSYLVTFDGGYYSSGIYYYRLEANDLIVSKKMILIK